jgi:head-tail adaptor
VKNKPRMRHTVDIMEPATALDDRGQENGDTVYLAGIPCSIEPLSTREQEAARQIYADATYRVKFYGDPKKPITHRHWLRWGERRLEIGSAVDVRMNGTEWECVCGEVVA